jgi:hypothetical protein
MRGLAMAWLRLTNVYPAKVKAWGDQGARSFNEIVKP